MSSLNKLTKAEEEVMHLVWDHGPCTVSTLIENMEDVQPPHSTISSIVRILENKGFVDHHTYGRTHVYFAIVDKKDYTKFSIKKLLSNYFEGSANELVSFLIKENDLSLKDLEAINTQFKNDKK